MNMKNGRDNQKSHITNFEESVVKINDVDQSSKADFLDTKIGEVFAIIVWVLTKVLTFIIFNIFGNALYYGLKLCSTVKRILRKTNYMERIIYIYSV